MLALLFFFFKQKTAYELRISDWSSDVCSSDLTRNPGAASAARRGINRRLLLLRRILHRPFNRLRPLDWRLDRIAQLRAGLRLRRLLRGRRRWPVARGASQRQQQRTRNHRRRSERPRHGCILDWPRRYATPNPKRKAAMDPHRWRLAGQLDRKSVG